MRLNNVEYPEKIIEAIKNNKLVIFAGAGVSMSSPTNLPNFNKLTEDVGKEVHDYKNEDETDDQYLGRLKNTGHNVNELVCGILNKDNPQPNHCHKILLDVFKDSDIRIVTTNFDIMFEKILENEGIGTKIYSYPALPYGDDFTGIIHLHGDDQNHKDIIVTDSDFGKAYMLRGKVSSFLKEMFESDYVVLFIGYSYNDTVMRYFTRALPDLSGEKRFIFVNKNEVDTFKSLGFTSIVYETRNFDQIYDSLNDLSNLVLKDENECSARIVDIINQNPDKNNEEFNYEIKEILANIHYNNKFFYFLEASDEWANYLFEEGYFENIFSLEKYNDFDNARMNWLINKILMNNTDLFTKFCYQKDFVLNYNFQRNIVDIIRTGNLDIDKIRILLNMLNFESLDCFDLEDLLQTCHGYSPKLDYEASQIFAECINFDLTRETVLYEKIEFKFKLQDSRMLDIWEIYKNFGNRFYPDILNEVSSKLQKITMFKNIEVKVEELTFYSFYDLENKEFSNERDEFMYILSKLLVNLNEEYKGIWINRYIADELPILKRTAIFLLTNTKKYSAEEKLKILKENNINILASEYREDLFVLYGSIFPILSSSEKKKFLDEVMNEKLDEKLFDERSSNYQKYNLLMWLKDYDSYPYIDTCIKEIVQIYSDFQPSKYPHKLIWPIEVKWEDALLPYSENELINNLDNLFKELLEYEGDGFSKARRSELISKIEEISIKNSNFRDRLIELLFDGEYYGNDLWKGIVKSLANLDISNDSFEKVYDNILTREILEKYTNELSKSIYSFLDKQEKLSKELINYILGKLKILWNYSSNCDSNYSDYMTRALNSSKGNIALSTISLIRVLNKENKLKELDNEYKEFIEKMLLSKVDDSLVVILGNASLLYYVDRKWTDKNIFDKFSSENYKLFNMAWNGFIYQSYLYKELAVRMEDLFKEAITNIDLLESYDIKKSILDRYTTIMISTTGDVAINYTNNIFKYVSEDLLRRFYIQLGKYIKGLNSVGKKEIFDRWILNFLERRIKNRPTQLQDFEKNYILEFVLEFPDQVAELQSIFKELKNPFVLDYRRISSLLYRNRDNSNYEIVREILIVITTQLKLNTEESASRYYSGIEELHDKLIKNNIHSEELEHNLKILNIIK